MKPQSEQDSARPQGQAERDRYGRLQPGNSVGADTRFPPGVSGNPGGMPKGTPSPKSALMRLVKLDPASLRRHKSKDMAEEVAKRLLLGIVKQDRDGNEVVDVRAVEVILERLDGKELSQTRQEHVHEIVELHDRRGARPSEN